MGSSADSLLTYEVLRPIYESEWKKCEIRPASLSLARTVRAKISAYKNRYKLVEERTKVPWYFVGALHYREADLNFRAWLHNGDPMFDHNGSPTRTVHVPRGRPADPHVSWEGGAVDALSELGANGLDSWPPSRLAWFGEKFNGFAYRIWHHIPSPYLWAGTSIQMPGKYTRDKHFDPSVMDEQLGIMAIFKLVLDEELGNA